MSLEKHFNELIDTLKRHPIITKVELIRKTLLNDEGYIRVIAKTLRGNKVHIFEYMIHGEMEKYAYHLQDPSERLIFRYDNRPHHPEINTFPHHKHAHNSQKPQPSRKQSLKEVLDEALKYE